MGGGYLTKHKNHLPRKGLVLENETQTYKKRKGKHKGSCVTVL